MQCIAYIYQFTQFMLVSFRARLFWVCIPQHHCSGNRLFNIFADLHLHGTGWTFFIPAMQGLEEHRCYEVLRDQLTLQLLCSCPSGFLRLMYLVANDKEGVAEAAETAADADAPADAAADGGDEGAAGVEGEGGDQEDASLPKAAKGSGKRKRGSSSGTVPAPR